jgi:hypothetical protein
MSSFTDLIVKACPDGKHWELTTPFTYHVGELGGPDMVQVPEGFITDFGSVPQSLWWLVSPIGKARPAYLLHDWLYYTGQRSRLVSDAILMEAMEVCGVSWFQRWLVWKGVRAGGWMAWKQHRKRRLL